MQEIGEMHSRALNIMVKGKQCLRKKEGFSDVQNTLLDQMWTRPRDWEDAKKPLWKEVYEDICGRPSGWSMH